ncbi:ABC transporter ATP-binding protein [Actinokineospora bangkokensis]|uniref:Dipeptide/oligopeptide/nickel ABC transporter ATP-binding protein n=1 Tax=Actinokineospora bangkokensis TaxID=1193682 RepID=A0A1Q9LBR4_9PSEU|nr:ABC transporter ATP-binding protein [Actinokineospora bangkokensis]OLR89445.1 dipeptide/oligopeptide/nickel ABC transporter ATP-binding protein [Actinokineospora bangkokensis]
MTTASARPVAADGDVVLAATGLTKHFPVRRGLREVLARTRRAVRAVDGVDLELRRGRVTAMVGESGSGKSTIARLLAQLYPHTSGRISLHGEEVSVRGGRAFRRYCAKVQMVFQDPFASLNPVHTIRYHLTRALTVHGRMGPGALEELLTRVQLTPPSRYLDKFPHELSGGQRQRVAIARALAADPEALLADEPVSMLDVSIRLGVLNLLHDLRTRLDLAILYITHDIASARYFADEVMVMYAGQVVEGGGGEAVTQRPAHPYTQLLVDSAPDPDRLGEAKDGGRGEPPSLISPPPGCRFAPRCPHVMARCTAEQPPKLAVDDDGHWAACWLHAGEAS